MAFVLTHLATGLTALMVGFWCTWGFFVLPALDQVPPTVAVASMRSLNESVLTPVFLVAFFALPVLSAAAALVVAADGAPIAAGLLGFAVGLQVLVIVITGTMNVPLNEQLAHTEAAAEEAWAAFSSAWQRAHRLRTVASGMALACCAAAWWVR